MKRILLRLVVLVVAAVILLLPLLAAIAPDTTASGPDPVRISDYQADYVVTADGTLVAKETLTTEFPVGRHGIFRFWDLSDPSDDHVRLDPQQIDVELDGRSVPVELSWQKGRQLRVAKIGDPDSTVSPGTHTYTVSYRIDGALSPTTVGNDSASSSSWADDRPSESVFYWNVVAQGWQMDIDQATIRMTLPAAAGQVQCTTGFGDAGLGPCTVAGDGTDTVTVTTGALPARTPVTVRIALPVPAPDRVTAPWGIEADGTLGQSRTALVVVLFVAVVLAGLGYVLDRRSREDEPGLPVTYEPPTGLGPVQTAYLTTEEVPERALVATLLHQAERGLTTLSHDDGAWTITGMGDAEAWAGTDDVTRHVGESLGVTQPGKTFRAGKKTVKAGEKLQSTRDELPAVVDRWAEGIGAQTAAPAEIAARVAVVMSFIAMVVVGIVAFVSPVPAVYALPFAGFALGGAGLLTAGVGKRRTALGRDLWSRSGGFERMLSTSSAKDRFDFSGKQELYTAFIPYAVAFDCADRWARKYETTTGAPAPSPVWLAGGTGSVGGGFGGGGDFSGFESSLAGAISAYSATQSSSSSGGGGGGGFSGGGGGGGGGGGSW
ncbi:DUF2207 domain-containing protein [Aeromicrobium fastidiosum]|uniref:DUF2207 domain-containing protein n=1 Tax=Aeromicrobium fastidiosum TaxID=52699 RepID=A0A641ALG0_9ACTN|nr:DUF2207 domain-containing protein [Aeromicrobium fastidiosum]KAA1376203.1 DUF2207 domain-containing protein [Aeromicrobium fastidiosum]MBP2391909.1 hypothetical protein [Aeromicrobium fastidiosum]